MCVSQVVCMCVSLPLSHVTPMPRDMPASQPSPPTLVQTPVVAMHRVRMDTFCTQLNQFTATLVLVVHLTMVMLYSLQQETCDEGTKDA